MSEIRHKISPGGRWLLFGKAGGFLRMLMDLGVDGANLGVIVGVKEDTALALKI